MNALNRVCAALAAGLLLVVGCGSTGSGAGEGTGQSNEALLSGSGKCKTATVTTGQSQSFGSYTGSDGQTVFVPIDVELIPGAYQGGDCTTSLTINGPFGQSYLCTYRTDPSGSIFKRRNCTSAGQPYGDGKITFGVTARSVSLGAVSCAGGATAPTARAVVGPQEIGNPCW